VSDLQAGPGSTDPPGPTESWRRRVEEIAALVLTTTLSRSPTLGGARLVCVDGPTGSGKSTLGEAIHAAAAGSTRSDLVHLDDLLDGWGGLPDVAGTLARDVLAPLREGRPGRYRRYDWHQRRFTESVVVDAVDLLVVEGVGSGASAYAEDITTLVWVDAPADLRLARGVARDGEAVRPELLAWMAREEDHLRRERSRERADILADGSTAHPRLTKRG
jgi:uridine kinase